MSAFSDPGLLSALEATPDDDLDGYAFGVIAMDREGVVVGYNRFESERAGIPPERVLGRHFFESVGPCTNNDLVAGRYLAEPTLDCEMDYVFTFRMRVSPVRLRLLARAGSPRQYLLVRPR